MRILAAILRLPTYGPLGSVLFSFVLIEATLQGIAQSVDHGLGQRQTTSCATNCCTCSCSNLGMLIMSQHGKAGMFVLDWIWTLGFC